MKTTYINKESDSFEVDALPLTNKKPTPKRGEGRFLAMERIINE